MRAPRLYIVTDRAATRGRSLVDVVARALDGAAGTGLAAQEIAVQLREKDLEGRALVELARGLRSVTAAAGAQLYVNDRVDVARAVDADGVHLGGGALPVDVVRRIAPALAIGVSTHSVAEARAAAAAGATFAVLGPIYDTPSKRGYGPALGLAPLAEAVRATGGAFPLLALGGIRPGAVRAALRAGAHGIACIRAIMAASDGSAAARAFCEELNST